MEGEKQPNEDSGEGTVGRGGPQVGIKGNTGAGGPGQRRGAQQKAAQNKDVTRVEFLKIEIQST